jgi:hypothetical protein
LLPLSTLRQNKLFRPSTEGAKESDEEGVETLSHNLRRSVGSEIINVGHRVEQRGEGSRVRGSGSEVGQVEKSITDRSDSGQHAGQLVLNDRDGDAAYYRASAGRRLCDQIW